MHTPQKELLVRSFHFTQGEIQELLCSLDMAVEGYDEFNHNQLTQWCNKDLVDSITKLLKNVIARKQEYDLISREQEF